LESAEFPYPTGVILARERYLSTVRIERWPFYRRFAAFVAACFIGTLATDIAYLRTANIMWADFSDWLLTGGVIVGWASVVVAVIETFVIRAPLRRRLRAGYAIGSVAALILATFDMFIHTRDAWTSVIPWGLALSTATVLVLILTGWVTWQSYEIAEPEEAA
jgi:uncharacterized membrane protein